MKKTVLTFGILSGLAISFLMYLGMPSGENPNYEAGEIYGYLTMIISLSFIFIGIKMLRDKYQSGKITFGRAFLAGFYISLISSLMYAVSWEIYLSVSKVDFMEKYADAQIQKMKTDGATEAAINEKTASMNSMKEYYKNPVLRFGITVFEMLPVGILISLISAGILRKKEILPAT